MPAQFPYLFLLTDIFKHGIWLELYNISDPKLRELAEYLPLVALQSRAPSTAKKYAGAFYRWRKWATTKSQVTHSQLSLYMWGCISYLIPGANTWRRQLICVEDPTGHSLVKQVLEGAKHIFAHKADKKEPITPEILRSLVDKYAITHATLADIRTLIICLLGFAGFFRYNELAKIKECDLQFFKEYLEIFVESSKTDQYRDGALVMIARTGTEYCPVAMLERYMQLADISQILQRVISLGN